MHQDDECHSFLALAIRDPDGIVGVISLANKEKVTSENSSTLSDDSVSATDSNIFTDNDERFVEAFAVFCGMAIRNAADYEVRLSFLLTLQGFELLPSYVYIALKPFSKFRFQLEAMDQVVTSRLL